MTRLLLLFALLLLLAAPTMAQDNSDVTDALINWTNILCRQAKSILSMYHSIAEETEDLYAIHESADTTTAQNRAFLEKMSDGRDLQVATDNFLNMVLNTKNVTEPFLVGGNESVRLRYTRSLFSARGIYTGDLHPAVARAVEGVEMNSHLVSLLWEYRYAVYRMSIGLGRPETLCGGLFPGRI